MERRGFIKGMLASIAGGTAMIKLAEPGEAQALVAQRNLLLAQPEPADFDAATQAMMQQRLEVYAYLKGKFVVIGYLRSIQVDQPVDALYSYEGEIRGTNPQYIAGMKEITMRFGGPTL